MKIVLIIIIYLVIGVLFALAPIFIDRGIFKYDDFYELTYEDNSFYDKKIRDNAVAFIVLALCFPFVFVIYFKDRISFKLGEWILKCHDRRTK